MDSKSCIEEGLKIKLTGFSDLKVKENAFQPLLTVASDLKNTKLKDYLMD